MTITLTPNEAALLIKNTARRFSDCIDDQEAAEEYAARLRELLDTYDEAVAKVEAESEAQKRPEDFPRTASEVQAMNS